MKKYVKQILIILLICFVIALIARREYLWSDRMIEKMPKNWVLINKSQSNYISYLTVIRIWSWFKRPIEEIIFLDTTSVRKANDTIFYANIYSAYLTEKDYSSIMFFDTLEKKFTSFQNADEFKDLSIDEIKNNFRVILKKDNKLYKVFDYFKKIKNYYAINALGDNIDITNYILSGQYTLENPARKYQINLINKQPYIISKGDESIITNGILKWLSEKDITLYKLPDEITYNAKYLYSDVFAYTPADVYEIKVNVNENYSEELLIQFTFSDQYFAKQYFPDYNYPKQIVVLNE